MFCSEAGTWCQTIKPYLCKGGGSDRLHPVIQFYHAAPAGQPIILIIPVNVSKIEEKSHLDTGNTLHQLKFKDYADCLSFSIHSSVHRSCWIIRANEFDLHRTLLFSSCILRRSIQQNKLFKFTVQYFYLFFYWGLINWKPHHQQKGFKKMYYPALSLSSLCSCW